MLEKIKFKEFKRLYRTRMVQDFPSNERPKLQGFRKRMLKYNEEVFAFILLDDISICMQQRRRNIAGRDIASCH